MNYDTDLIDSARKRAAAIRRIWELGGTIPVHPGDAERYEQLAYALEQSNKCVESLTQKNAEQQRMYHNEQQHSTELTKIIGKLQAWIVELEKSVAPPAVNQWATEPAQATTQETRAAIDPLLNCDHAQSPRSECNCSCVFCTHVRSGIRRKERDVPPVNPALDA